MKISVLKSGLFTSIQDAGRFGYEQYGIPQNGYLDVASAELANQLVGNDKQSALIEITGTGPTLQFDSDCTIALTGADISPTINHKFTSLNTILVIKAGDVLSFGKLKSGFRTYLAISGTINVPDVYGSKSTNTLAKFGGYQGGILAKGDVLDIKLHHNFNTGNKLTPTSIPVQSHIIQIERGPEYDWFSFQEISKFMHHIFTVSTDSNRMGYRLEGNWLTHKSINSIISSGNVPGVIQVTPSLQPIILLNDAGTTGGYPRIAICTQKGINKLSQLKTRDALQFTF